MRLFRRECFSRRLDWERLLQSKNGNSAKRKGKSGGARVITCVKIVNETIYLLTIYDKSEQENINEKELDQLLTQVGL